MKLSVMYILLLLITSCHGVPVWRQSIFDHPPAKPDGSRDYHPDYIKGWRDGCHTAAAATHNHFMKNFYDFKKDYELYGKNVQYANAWNHAWRYCTTFVSQHNWNWYGKRVI